jgi:hypothetical protein
MPLLKQEKLDPLEALKFGEEKKLPYFNFLMNINYPADFTQFAGYRS